jgi:predicted metal-dependent hydrolase
MDVKIIRSAKRTRTISARREGDTMLLYLPADLTPEEEQHWIDRMRARLERKETRRKLNTDEALRQRADELNREYFGGQLKVAEIRYVTNQDRRFGSCTPSTATIRLSHRLADMPTWVLDYVIVHELAHLLQPNHSPRFWKLVNRYKLTERARGFLIAKGMEGDEDDDE